MKKQLLITVIIGLFLFIQNHANAQFITNGSNQNWFGQPDNTSVNSDNWTRSVGVGYFGSNFTNSLLHVDGNNMILPQNGSINSLGEVFRTDAPNTSGNDTYWRMLHGGSVKFNIRNKYNSHSVDLQTVQNGHINLYTNSIHRIKLNPDINYTINGYVGDRDGYLLLGNSTVGMNDDLFAEDTLGAFSLLHLNGPRSYQSAGYRPWMQTGVTFTDNADLSYMGMRNVSTSATETVVAWANDGDGGSGPDDLCFRFIGGGEGVETISSDMSVATDLDGLHVARFTPSGNIGFGPTFGAIDAMYVRPRSLLHMSLDGTRSPWLQLTNANGTGQTADDGLRIGVGGAGVAYVRQQENQPLIFQTDWDNTAGGIADGERMRITTIGAPSVPDPAGAVNNNITRVAISHNGSTPITEPRSLLHLGYNTGIPVASNDGWRNWMDVGMFVNRGSDNIYVGLKQEDDPSSPVEDRYDAVIGWGDNQAAVSPLNVGPDNLRFIFTSTTDLTAGDSISTSYNGLEVARMEPGLASTLSTSNYDYGMMGIGNFAPGSRNDINATPVDAKLDIDGDLRIREVTEDTTLNMVLVIDTNDLGRVHWRSIDDLGGGSGVGNYCTEPDDTLSGHYEIPLNDYNYYFTGSEVYSGSGFNTNGVGIGIPCGNGLSAKLHVLQDQVNSVDSNPYSITGAFENTDTSAFIGYGVVGISRGDKVNMNIGGHFFAIGATKDNVGVRGFGRGTDSNFNYGGRFEATNGTYNYGVYAEVTNDSADGPNYAGYFDGPVTTSGGYWTFSDESLKEHVEPIQSAAAILAQLTPVEYDMRYQQYPNISLSRNHQIGLIAQEVEQVLPDIVGDVIHPAKYDSLGNEIAPQMQLKGVNYTQLIPLLIAGFQEQQTALAQKDHLINDLAERLEALETCVREANLCQATPQQRLSGEGEPIGQYIELKNLNAIILDQNLPNPFAERTTITYTIPEEVMKAELVFYDMRGRIINQMQINERGQGKMTVYGENLQNGVYTYSLIADGKLIDTKKMVKQ